MARYGKGDDPDEKGSVRDADFSLLGQEFVAMDSAREHKFGLRRSSIALMNPSLMREHHRKSAVFGELVWLFRPTWSTQGFD